MFQRRIKPSYFERIRGLLWPRAGWRRSSRYFAHRVARLPGTPYSIASGFAIGAAVSFTPFIGFHFVLSALFSLILRANLVASLLGTIVGNPWTFPFIWLWLYHSGLWILGSDPSVQGVHFNMAVLWDFTVEGVSYVGRGLIFGIWNATEQADLARLWSSIVDIIWPMIVGCIPTVVFIWLLFYFPVYRAVVMYRHKRILRRMTIHEKRALKPVLETAKRTLLHDTDRQQDDTK